MNAKPKCQHCFDIVCNIPSVNSTTAYAQTNAKSQHLMTGFAPILHKLVVVRATMGHNEEDVGGVEVTFKLVGDVVEVACIAESEL